MVPPSFDWCDSGTLAGANRSVVPLTATAAVFSGLSSFVVSWEGTVVDWHAARLTSNQRMTYRMTTTSPHHYNGGCGETESLGNRQFVRVVCGSFPDFT